MKKSLRRWVWMAASAIVLVLIFYNLSRSTEWREFSWERLSLLLSQARPGWLLPALGATYSTYLVRAYRWKFFLDPIKKASLWVLFVGQVLGFSSIYLIGRLGEFVRPAYIARKENVPFSSMMAVWLLERIYDTFFMVVLFATALGFASLNPTTGRGALVLNAMQRGSRWMLVVMGLIVVVLVVFRLRAEELTARISGWFSFLPGCGPQYLGKFLRSFSDGLEVIRNWKGVLATLLCSAVLWALNASVFWLVLQSLGGGLERLSWLAAGLVLFCAAVALVWQVPVIGGGFQVGAILVLRELFGVGVEAATSAAILIWIMISVPCLALGAALLAYEGLTFKKLEAIAEEERAATEEKASR